MSPHCILWYGMVLYFIWSYCTVSHCHVPLLQRAGELPRSASSHFTYLHFVQIGSLKYRVVLFDKCAIFGSMEALPSSEQNLASIALSLLSIWLQSSVRLTVGAGVRAEQCFEEGWEDVGLAGAETKTKDFLTSASIWQWFFLIRFFHFELPFPFIKCVTCTLWHQKPTTTTMQWQNQ